MGWHEAYLKQARSEAAIMKRLAASGVEYCHRLHYLQMVTEKLAKALLTPAGSARPAPTTHTALVRMLQVLKGRPEIREMLGFSDARLFASYVDSLLNLAITIQRLSPDQAGLTQANPEYPWEDLAQRQVVAPIEYDFPLLDPRDPKLVKFDRLLNDLLRIVN